MSEKCPKCGAALKHNQREDWKCGTFIDPGQAPSLVVSAQCRVNVLEAEVAALEAKLECSQRADELQTKLCDNLIAENERLKADNRAYFDERQQLRDILCVPITTSEGTQAAEFGACYPLLESAKLLRAERDRLLTAGRIALVPAAMLMGERAE